MIEPDRVKILKDRPERDGDYVLYWMQQSQRAGHNPALEWAIGAADRLGLPVVVGFGLTEAYPDARERHYAFMLEGLAETARALADRGILLVLRLGEPPEVAAGLADRAALVVCDRGYLRHQRAWRRSLAERLERRLVQVEGDAVVPVETASGKAESQARTIRPKLMKRYEDYLRELPEATPRHSSLGLGIRGDADPADVDGLLARLDIDRSVGRVRRLIGGRGEARRRLDRFVETTLPGYAQRRNEPADWHSSMLSPYLHFGHISPVELVLAARRAERAPEEDRAGFLEELIVRRELSINFVHYSESTYDTLDCLQGWARKSLDEHRRDVRDPCYSQEELEQSRTDDRYWNAAMKEMRTTGFMHNYMRMYWGKKILEWSPSPEVAHARALAINNKYFLDGRDPNSFANVAWLFGKHDRAWQERPIYGKTRYMAQSGLQRKFDINRYVSAVDRLAAGENPVTEP